MSGKETTNALTGGDSFFFYFEEMKFKSEQGYKLFASWNKSLRQNNVNYGSMRGISFFFFFLIFILVEI